MAYDYLSEIEMRKVSQDATGEVWVQGNNRVVIVYDGRVIRNVPADVVNISNCSARFKKEVRKLLDDDKTNCFLIEEGDDAQTAGKDVRE